MATNVLQRMLDQCMAVSIPGAAFFKAVFPSVVQAAEHQQGLPVTKTTLRAHLANPVAAIMLRPPSRAEELEQMETLLGFVQHRLSSDTEKARLEHDLETLLGASNPELLITQDGIPSQLYGVDRSEASQLFTPLLTGQPAETAEALVEAYVLLRSNQADVQSGIAKLFWRQDAGPTSAAHYIEGCADGQTRAYFRALLSQPEERQLQLFSTINLETFYATLGSIGARN
jgi:hypothetical protein